MDLLEMTQDEPIKPGLDNLTNTEAVHVLNQHRCRSSQEVATPGHGFQSDPKDIFNPKIEQKRQNTTQLIK